MRSVEDARTQLLAALPILPVEAVPVAEAAGRVLAQPLVAGFDLPAFDNSSMDGFAVRADDLAGADEASPARLAVVADIPAGDAPAVAIEAGQAARIMTGAALPEGADAVVPVERTDFGDRSAGTPAPEQVRIFTTLPSGAYVRRRGEDVRRGEAILNPGIKLLPRHVGMAAMLGAATLQVHRQPHVAVLSTGDELLPPGAALKSGKIFESNSLTLAALLQEAGCRVELLGIARDEAREVQDRLDRGAEIGVDLIISSAGVSVGAYDYVKSVVEANGSLDFWRVNMRPGKPLAFGSYRGIPFVGLPGNPVSAYVGFEVFLRPALARMSGWTAWRREARAARLGEALDSDGRESYLRCLVTREDGAWIARLTGHQGSGNHYSLVQANAILIVPAGVRRLEPGDEIQFWRLN